MEKYEQKRRKLFGKQLIPSYLKELKNILLIDVKVNNLLSIVDTDSIVENNKAKQLSKNITFFFDQKEEELIKLFNNDISSYYVFIEHTNQCGAVKINSIKEFKFNFDFDSLSAQIITLTREDLRKTVVLDFYEENNSQYLEIKVYS